MTALWRALRQAVGVDEVLLAVALGLTTAGIWPWLGFGALTVPGLVLLWMVLPERRPFVGRPGAEASVPKRRKG